MALKTQYLNFHIPDLHNIKLIGFADVSLYVNNNPLVNPTIEVTPPGYNKVAVPFSKGGFIVLNSNNLDITCGEDDCDLVDLPDGIWTAKYSFAPIADNNVEKTFLRTDSIQKTFGQAVLRTDIKQCSQDIKDNDMDTLDQVWYLIQGAIASAAECNTRKAMEMYDLANKILKNFIKCH